MHPENPSSALVFEVKQADQSPSKTPAYMQSEEALFNELFMKKHNRLFPDGRVHTGQALPELGPDAFMAVSVSPKFTEFESQIEPPIYPAVKALVNKGYHTISSCAGHPTRIHLQIGFGSEESRQDFLDIVLAARLPALKWYFLDHVANIEHNDDNSDEFQARKGHLNEVEETNAYVIKVNADSFNFQFKTKYERWYFLDLNIMDPTRNPFIELYQRYVILPKKAQILTQLADLMRSDAVPSYKDLYYPKYIAKRRAELRKKIEEGIKNV
ncbi:hypothetical protein AB6D11_00050 [Vibrio splendidus]